LFSSSLVSSLTLITSCQNRPGPGPNPPDYHPGQIHINNASQYHYWQLLFAYKLLTRPTCFSFYSSTT
jgi:hypothetical protein